MNKNLNSYKVLNEQTVLNNEIVESVWNNYLDQFEDSRKLMKKLTKELNKAYSKCGNKFRAELFVGSVILKSKNEKAFQKIKGFDNLEENLFNFCYSSFSLTAKSGIKTILDLKNLIWTSRCLFELKWKFVSKESKKELLRFISTLNINALDANGFNETQVFDLKINLFLLYCKIFSDDFDDNELRNGLYILSMYSVLKEGLENNKGGNSFESLSKRLLLLDSGLDEYINVQVTFLNCVKLIILVNKSIKEFQVKEDEKAENDTDSESSFKFLGYQYDILIKLYKRVSKYRKETHNENFNYSKLAIQSFSSILENERNIIFKSAKVMRDKNDLVDPFSNIKQEVILKILKTIRMSLTENGWMISQYLFEMVIILLSNLANKLILIESDSELNEEIYLGITGNLSIILNNHRFRLNDRNHLIIKVFESLLECFSNESNNRVVSSSDNCVESFNRLLSNLCEPSNENRKPEGRSKNKNENKKENESIQLSSASNLIKGSLRKYLVSFLVNFIYISLNYQFRKNEHKNKINEGMYVVFDALTQDELIMVNSLLDNTGRIYYKKIYGDYKKFGKWISY
ncbi:ribosome biogenesis protein URB2 ASCRUDRAFT_81333 [Ascoidea rubescens DSM 1968]|uniref:Nucleolar 27S pre-rRNA processing Urb2/Npa2 C-terminal domain-containing protein n=1 Tax=Ascoidea rubescens DSM 1968 TaxID=1344418 RepID=A0A1D2VF85_9ASCO|nr:hypothetical protein ASCRUDRAFT_81333 [Ascoidea rubescens DSM 1968]ODV60348.1 hypothetical protein ASCRUDRAFT_81333 [Ascoidea rubescens DSM 1968]